MREGFSLMASNRKSLDLLLGRPWPLLKSAASHIGPVAGIPIFGLDALSSAAYGPEAALTLLIPLGLMGVKEIVPISAAILTLLIIVYFSYRQTIDAYPHGGGSFTVASENLGDNAGLLAAAALMIDYVSDGRGGYLGWRGRADLGRAFAAAAYARALPGDSGAADADQHARSA
jgi:hypothetical protein